MFEQSEAYKQYVAKYFNVKPEKPYSWKYSARDLTDEFLIWIFFLALAVGVWVWLFVFIKTEMNETIKWILFGIASLPALIYGGYVVYLYFIKRVFVTYGLTTDFFTVTDGFISRKNITIHVGDIVQVNVTQTLWERIVGVGTITLILQKHNSTEQYDLPIRGIAVYKEMRDAIEYYRNYYRIVRANALINA